MALFEEMSNVLIKAPFVNSRSVVPYLEAKISKLAYGTLKIIQSGTYCWVHHFRKYSTIMLLFFIKYVLQNHQTTRFLEV